MRRRPAGRRGPPRRRAPIAINADVSGLITRADPRLRDSSASTRLFPFQGLPAGQIVQIDLMSSEFDAFLILQDSTGKGLTHDDDKRRRPQHPHHQPRSPTPPAPLRSCPTPTAQGQYGHYTLRMKGIGVASENIPTSGVLPGTVGQILRGQTVTGSLTTVLRRSFTDSSVYQAWTFVGHEGERIKVDVVSSDFDAYGIIQDGNGVEA